MWTDNKGQDMDEFFGAKVILNDEVKYVGEGEDPSKDPYMIAFASALKKIYQPERSKREDFDFKILDRALKRARRAGAWDQEDYDEISRLVEYQRCGALNSMET